MPPAIREVVIIFSILYLLIFLFTTFESIIKWTEANRLKEIAESAATKAELKSLKSQLNPHFLFNTMNSIYALALKKSHQTPEMVLKLSELLDYTLLASNQDFIEMEKELESIKNLIYIEKVRHGTSFQFQLSQNNIIGKNIIIPPLMLLSIVENGIKHGDYQVGKPGTLTLDLKLESEQLFIISRNPINRNKATSNGGLGLKNLKDQLKLLYQDYELNSFEEEDFYQIEISVHL
jgi:LytS/YehU family sensor histidine kinase